MTGVADRRGGERAGSVDGGVLRNNEVILVSVCVQRQVRAAGAAAWTWSVFSFKCFTLFYLNRNVLNLFHSSER